MIYYEVPIPSILKEALEISKCVVYTDIDRYSFEEHIIDPIVPPKRSYPLTAYTSYNLMVIYNNRTFVLYNTRIRHIHRATTTICPSSNEQHIFPHIIESFYNG